MIWQIDIVSDAHEQLCHPNDTLGIYLCISDGDQNFIRVNLNGMNSDCLQRSCGIFL